MHVHVHVHMACAYAARRRGDYAEHARVLALDHEPIELAVGHHLRRLEQRGVRQDAQRLADVLAHLPDLVRVGVRVGARFAVGDFRRAGGVRWSSKGAHATDLCCSDLVETLLLGLVTRVGGNGADGAEQVVAGQDADNSAVLHDGRARDAVAAEQLRNGLQVVLDVHANHRA